jgi:hypothetical protein
MRLVAAIGSALLLSTVLAAQAQTPTGDGTGFEKKNYNYSEWTKGLFSEVVTVTHPGKMIFLAGVGAEDESGGRGTIRHLGDFARTGLQPRNINRKDIICPATRALSSKAQPGESTGANAMRPQNRPL